MSEPSFPIQYVFVALLIAVALVAGMLLAMEAGRLIGRRRIAAGVEGPSGVGPVEGAVFGLLGLLIAFTFSGAAARFDQRRELIVEEANNIGTAYLRLDLLPADARPELRALFREYLDTRLATYRKLPEDLTAADAELAKSVQLQNDIWQKVVAASQRASSSSAAILLLPAVSAMLDIATTRTIATWMHPPWIIYAMLFALAMVSALLAGYGMAVTARRNWVHMLAFAVALGLSSYVILDMEFPRLGLIRVTHFDQALVQLRRHMN